MRAAVMEGINQLTVRDFPMPVITEDEVLVKVKAASICGSDIESLQNGMFMGELPIVMGHEVSGVVVEVGRNTEGIKVGDPVALEPNVPCWKCNLCRRGFYHLCAKTLHIGNSMHGGYAEYVKIHYMNAYKISDKISFEEACLMEPVGVCLEGIRQGNLRMCERVLIIGNGPFGLIFAQLARCAGADQVFVSGRRENRNLLAAAYGAMVIDDNKEDMVARVMEETEGRGVDLIIDCAGTPEIFAPAFEAVSHRGRIVLFSHTKSKIHVDITPVQMKEVTISGSVNNPHTCEDVANLLDKKRIDLSKIITHRYALDQIHEAMDVVENKRDDVIKAILVFD